MNERRTSVPGEAKELAVLTRFLQEFWSQASLPPAEALCFELALEEIFMNVVMHGSPAGGVVQVDVSLLIADGDVKLTIEDNGREFDPLTLPEPNLEANLADRPIGGLGVFLVRQLMDGVSYHRIGSHNRLCVSKHIETARHPSAQSGGADSALKPE